MRLRTVVLVAALAFALPAPGGVAPATSCAPPAQQFLVVLPNGQTLTAERFQYLLAERTFILSSSSPDRLFCSGFES